MLTRAPVLALVVLALALLALPAPARASEALWALLKGGGEVVIMRHASTDSTVGAPATLAFGIANPWLPLNSFFRDREAGQTGAVRELVSLPRVRR